MAYTTVNSSKKNLWCTSHRTCLCIFNKWISGVTVAELDFAFYNKSVGDIPKILKMNLLYKNVLHLFPLCTATFN